MAENPRSCYLLGVGNRANMIQMAVCQDDELNSLGIDARFLEHAVQGRIGAWHAGIDKDLALVRRNEIDVGACVLYRLYQVVRAGLHQLCLLGATFDAHAAGDDYQCYGSGSLLGQPDLPISSPQTDCFPNRIDTV